MNKSKFLKKSLAMLLALMLVVAMIPLSAAAAEEYTPKSTVEPVAVTGSPFAGDPVATGDGWTVEFGYKNAAPEIAIRLGHTEESIRYIKNDGTYSDATASGATIQLWYDKDTKLPAPLQFQVFKTSDTSSYSKTYTINWSVASASSEITVKSAKLGAKGEYAGVVDNAAGTIKFTVPFGYNDDKTLKVEANDGVDTSGIAAFGGTIASNTVKGVAQVVTLRAENGEATKDYTITVEEADALTAFALGEYTGTFEKKADDNSLESGNIIVNLPAGTAKDADGKLLMTPTFTVGSDYKKVEIAKAAGKDSITSGKEYDFAYALDQGNTGVAITVTSDIDTTRTYTLKLVVDQTSTAISDFTVKDSNAFVATGVVDGKNLSAELSKEANLAAATTEVVFSVPTGTKVKVGTENEVTAADGKATVILTKGYSAPLSVVVTSADGKFIAYYTLTLTKAEAANTAPAINAAKVTVTVDTKKVEYTGTVSGQTITFNVPYSLTAAQVKGGTFTFAKTAQTKEVGNVEFDANDIFGAKAENTVKVTSDSGDVVTYKLVFTKAAANTGKAISDFILTKADNVNLVEYSTTYNVTASGDKLKITLPKTVKDNAAANKDKYKTTFTLSEGAKFYSVEIGATTLNEIKSEVNADTGAITSEIDLKDMLTDKQQYVIADEYLAYDIANSVVTDLATVQKTVKYNGHYTVYTVEATETNRTASTLNTIGANDGLVSGTKKDTTITLNVPFSYVADTADDATGFFLDYTVSAGAKLQAAYNDGTDKTIDLISGGVKEWKDNKVSTADSAAATNPNFKVVKAGSAYELQVLTADTPTYTKVNSLKVVAEEGKINTEYKYEIKVNAAETGAVLTSVKVGNYNGTINGQTVTVALPFGTNLGAQTLTLGASKLATVTVTGYPDFENGDSVSLTKDLKITVTSENGATINVYTLKAVVAEQFSDVQPGAWYYDNVMAAVDAGIVSGLGNGTFNPMGNVTRRDFSIMVVRLLLGGKEPPKADTTPFSDVSASDYAVDYIAYCAENGIISGSNGMFRPGDKITRQEAASIMKNALKLTGTTSELFTDDAKIANWAKGNVYACKAAGIFTGDEKGNFNPTSSLTRAEAASIMVNAMNQ